MPIVDDDPLLSPYTPPTGQPYFRSEGSVPEAAFDLESDILALYHLWYAPRFTYEPGFSLTQRLRRDFPDGREPDDFLGVGSEAAYQWRKAELARREQSRRIISDAGPSGYLWAMTASVVSPTSLVPLTLGARGFRAVGEALLLAGGSIAAQEAVLRVDQPDRTREESLTSIFTGMALGGLLGGAAALTSRRHFNQIRARAEPDQIAVPPEVTREPPGVTQPLAEAAAVIARQEGRPREAPAAPLAPEVPVGTALGFGILTRNAGGIPLSNFLNLSRAVQEQPEIVAKLRAALKNEEPEAPLRKVVEGILDRKSPGDSLYRSLTKVLGGDRQAAEWLERAGIAGTLKQKTLLRFRALEPEPPDVPFRLEGLRTPKVRPDMTPEQFQEEAAATFLAAFRDQPALAGKTEKEFLKDFRFFLEEGITPTPELLPFLKGFRQFELSLVRQVPEAVGSQVATFVRDKVEGPETVGPDLVQGPFPVGSSIGAVELKQGDAGPVARAVLGVERLLGPMNPHVRTINQTTSLTARTTMQALGNTALLMHGNKAVVDEAGNFIQRGVPTSPGGSVEGMANAWLRNVAEAHIAVERAYTKYYAGTTGLRASIMADLGQFIPDGKLSFRQFRRLVGQAMEKGDVGEIAEVTEAARTVRALVYDPLYNEAVRVGLLAGTEEVKGAQTFLNRVYNVPLMVSRRNEFERIVAEHLTGKLNAEFVERWGKLKVREAQLRERGETIQLPPERVAAQREALEAEQAALFEIRDPETDETLASIDADIALLRRLGRQQNKDWAQGHEKGLDMKAGPGQALLSEADRLEARVAERLKEFRERRAEIRRRFRDLDGTWLVLKARQVRALDVLERAEQQSYMTLRASAERIAKLERDVMSASDKEVDRVFGEVKRRLEKAEAAQDTLAKKIDDLRVKGILDEAIAKLEERFDTRAESLTRLRKRADGLDPRNRAELRDLMEQVRLDLLQRGERLIGKRLARRDRLMEKVLSLDPRGRIPAELKRLEEQRVRARERLEDVARGRGAADIDLDKGLFDFQDTAKDLARAIASKIIGTDVRLPTYDMIGLRGTELLRHLDIPRDRLILADGRSFLEDDIEELIGAYSRTLAPDVEMMRRFRTVNIFGKDENGEYNSWVMRAISDEAAAARERAEALPSEKRERALRKIDNEYRNALTDLTAVVDRIKHVRGLPKYPDAFMARAGRTMLHLNQLRLLGGTLISSIPDIGFLVAKFGLRRFFMEGLWPLITDWKSWKASAYESKMSGAGYDAILYSRAKAFADIVDSYGKRTVFERGVEYLSNRMGIVGGFAQWTTFGKQMAAVLWNAKVMDAVEAVAGGKKVPPGVLEDYMELLNRTGLAPYVRPIWDEMNRLGATEVDGVRYPNTEDWTTQVTLPNGQEASLAHLYHGAMNDLINNTIVTPGTEKPLFADASIGTRLIFQLRSFNFSTTTKLLVAGLQRPNMALLEGAITSLALGAASYYLWATAAGGERQAEMLRASPERWLDEAIARSGLLGVLAEVQNVAETIPGVERYVRLAGERTAGRQGVETIEAIGGPSVDFAFTLNKFLAGIDDPTRSTVHQARLLMPYQNLWFLRQAIDELEQKMGFPESRR